MTDAYICSDCGEPFEEEEEEFGAIIEGEDGENICAHCNSEGEG